MSVYCASQGRTHPEIAEFPNQMFYFHERLEPVPCPHQIETVQHYDPGI